MAIVTIQHRRGEYADYDPSKVLPGELVVTQTGDPNTTDGEAAYIATRAGSVKRIPFATEVEDLKTQVEEVVEDAEEAISNAIDPTLKQSGKAADAKKTGDEIADLKSDISKIEPGLSDAAKIALLNSFAHVAWVDEHGQDYYDALETALYAEEYPKITATFNSGSNIIYTDDSIDSIKQYLTVKYFETRESTGIVIASNDYALSGELVEGSSNILVSYNNLTTSFTINGVVDFYNIWEWSTEYSGVGALTKTGPLSDVTKNNARRGYELILPVQSLRFGIGVLKGKQPAIKRSDSTPTTLYPVPIPKTATKVTITITPSTDYLFGYVGRYEAGSQSEGYDYVMLNETASWTHQGSYTCTFAAGENMFLGYNGKKPDNSAYTDEERAERVVTVVFE